jgi:hypothetical protein
VSWVEIKLIDYIYCNMGKLTEIVPIKFAFFDLNFREMMHRNSGIDKIARSLIVM